MCVCVRVCYTQRRLISPLCVQDLKRAGLLRGSLTVEQQHQLIQGSSSLEDAVSGCKYLQVSTQQLTQLGNEVLRVRDTARLRIDAQTQSTYTRSIAVDFARARPVRV